MTTLGLLDLHKNMICGFHTHAAEVRDEVHTVRVARKLALRALSRLFSTYRKHIPTMAAPISTHIGKALKTMWNAVVDLFFVRISLSIRLADAFSNDLRITSFVARVFAVCALHASCVLEKVTAQRATHDVVECLQHELMAILLNDVFFLLSDSALSSKTNIESFAFFDLFDKRD